MKLPCIFRIFLVTLLLFAVCDAMQGGTTEPIENAPYTALLGLWDKESYYTYCGASILSENWVLSAAHCVKSNVKRVTVRVGTNYQSMKGTLYNVSQIIAHEDYSNATRWNSDIVLIKVAKPIQFNERVKPIPISCSQPKTGDNITITGYGGNYTEYSYMLTAGVQPVIPLEQCQEKYSKTDRQNISITINSFCTDPKITDLCHGDSGNPAVLNGNLVGITVEGCEAPLPNIFTNVVNYYDWIVSHTQLKCS